MAFRVAERIKDEEMDTRALMSFVATLVYLSSACVRFSLKKQHGKT